MSKVVDEIDKAFDAPAPKGKLAKATVVRPLSKKPTPKAKTPLVKRETVEDFRTIRLWIDARILPILAWIGLIGLAVVGTDTILNHLSDGIRISASIFIVAFLAFKLP